MDYLARRELIRGDKLRDLILLVYLNNKYGLGTAIRPSKLRQYLRYSTGGFYNALDESGYFTRKGDEIQLSSKGERYARMELMSQFRAFNPIAYFLVFFGIVLMAHWYLYTFYKTFLFFDWTVGMSFTILGLVLRFALPFFVYWFLKITKRL